MQLPGEEKRRARGLDQLFDDGDSEPDSSSIARETASGGRASEPEAQLQREALEVARWKLGGALIWCCMDGQFGLAPLLDQEVSLLPGRPDWEAPWLQPLGSIIWCKMQGFHWWPAEVALPAVVDRDGQLQQAFEGRRESRQASVARGPRVED